MKISLKEAVSHLCNGNLVALPTETVYGLAAALPFPLAIDTIFRLKGRPSNNPLIIHLNSANEIKNYVQQLSPQFDTLAKAFWPGPLTIVLPVRVEMISEKVRAGLPTAAFRVPSHPLIRKILSRTPPLVMPSANPSGFPSATSAEHVAADFGDKLPVVDGGSCNNGIESTVIGYIEEKWQILRQGAITPEELANILGYTPPLYQQLSNLCSPLCPGQLLRHYSPKAKITITYFGSSKTAMIQSNTAILGFSDRTYPSTLPCIPLGRSDNPAEVARRLYTSLREIDRLEFDQAWVDGEFPTGGLWDTIRERLMRAASAP